MTSSGHFMHYTKLLFLLPIETRPEPEVSKTQLDAEELSRCATRTIVREPESDLRPQEEHRDTHVTKITNFIHYFLLHFALYGNVEIKLGAMVL